MAEKPGDSTFSTESARPTAPGPDGEILNRFGEGEPGPQFEPDSATPIRIAGVEPEGNLAGTGTIPDQQLGGLALDPAATGDGHGIDIEEAAWSANDEGGNLGSAAFELEPDRHRPLDFDADTA